MTQRITLILLLLLVIGEWGLLLRPAVTPLPVQAQDGGSRGSGLISTSTGLYYHSPNGYLYRFAPDLTLLDRAVPTLRASAVAGQNTASYTVVHEHSMNQERH